MPLSKFLSKTLGVSGQNMIDHFQANIRRINSWFSPLNRLPRAHERRLAFELDKCLTLIQMSGPKLQISVQVFIS